MPLRFFVQLLKACAKKVPPALNVRVGQMAPTTKPESIKLELEIELQQNGPETLHKRMHAEELILEQLLATRSEVRQRIRSECLAPTTSRFIDGYSVSGLFWKTKQDALHQIISPNNYQKIEENIDWLMTRQKFFEQIKKSPHSPGETKPCCAEARM